jgi:hypothetical protein
MEAKAKDTKKRGREAEAEGAREPEEESEESSEESSDSGADDGEDSESEGEMVALEEAKPKVRHCRAANTCLCARTAEGLRGTDA